MRPKIIGIVGGMGPEAGYALGNYIIKNTCASTDQDHLPVILISFPQNMVDRTEYILGHTEKNPGYEIANVILKLEQVEAEVVGIACNTAHAPGIFSVIENQLNRLNSKVKLLNMPLETCGLIKREYPFIKRVGIMSTNGTYISGIYKNLLTQCGYEVIVPDFKFQDTIIHNLIYHPHYGIKANPHTLTSQAKHLLGEAFAFFKLRGAELIILGCTELALVLSEKEYEDMLLVDSNDALSQALVKESLSQ